MPATAPKQQYERAEVAARLIHVSERQLQTWERMGLVPAASTYSFRDLIALRAIAELRAHRIPLRTIGSALASLKQRLSEVHDPLAELKIFSDGRNIAVRVAGQNMVALTGQILFDFDTSELASVQSLPPQPPPPAREQDSEAWFQKGLFLEETGAPIDEAVEAYLQAVEFNPQAAGALVDLGTIRYRLRQFQEAEDYYTRALAADPPLPAGAFQSGQPLRRARRPGQSATLATKPPCASIRAMATRISTSPCCASAAVTCCAPWHHWKAYLKIDHAGSWADIARRQLEKLR